MRRGRGFTLVELVVVLAVMAILAGAAVPFFVGPDTARSMAAHRRVALDLRYAQRLAMATGQTCGVEVTSATKYRVFQGSETAKDFMTEQAFVIDLSQSFPGATISPASATVSFDPRGRPAPGSASSLTVAGRAIKIVEETGAIIR